MKHKKSISQTYIDRNRKVLPELVRRAKHIATYPTTMKQLCHIAAELPTDRFYISDDAAYEYIRQRVLKNKKQKFRHVFRQQLFDALYEQVLKLKRMEKYKDMDWKNVTILALAQPAPCVGLTPYIIHKILWKRRNNKRVGENE